MGCRKQVHAIYFDVAKAYDKVTHVFLLRKLTALGIQPRILRWIQDFPTDRTFQMRVGEEMSAILGISSGVPQGSVLSPILVFTADLPTLITASTVICMLVT